MPVGGGGPGRATGGRPTLQTSSNQHDLNRLARTSVTNVVNLSPKTSIFSEKADGLTTFVTTGQKSTRKTPWIDDVCNNTRQARRQHTRHHLCGGRRRDLPRCPWAAAGPGRASRSAVLNHQTATRHHWCGGRRRGLPRCRWVAAGPGRASRRRAERSSRRGRLAGGPPPTGTHSGRALRHPTARGHTKPPGHRGRAAQSVSEAHRRITTMSGSPRPLSWRTLEIPSLAAISFAVPSMRGSS